jgi:hypothetical protein
MLGYSFEIQALTLLCVEKKGRVWWQSLRDRWLVLQSALNFTSHARGEPTSRVAMDAWLDILLEDSGGK